MRKLNSPKDLLPYLVKYSDKDGCYRYKEIQEKTGVDKSTLAFFVQDLDRMGLIELFDMSGDGRVLPKGKELIKGRFSVCCRIISKKVLGFIGAVLVSVAAAIIVCLLGF